MNMFLLQLRSVWPKALLWALITLVVVGAEFYCFRHLPPSLPDGFETSEEAAQIEHQFDPVAYVNPEGPLSETATQVSRLTGSTKVEMAVGGLCFLPLFFLSLGSFGKLMSVLENQRYVVLSVSLVGQCASATISMEADSSMIDRLSHVNYIASVSNLDCGREVLMQSAMGWDLQALHDKHRLAFMIRSIEVKYCGQIRKGDPILISCKMNPKGRTSVALDFELFARGENKPAVVGSYLMPLVSIETGKAEAIPDWLWEQQRT